MSKGILLYLVLVILVIVGAVAYGYVSYESSRSSTTSPVTGISPTELVSGTFRSTCAPWDGPAINVTLSLNEGSDYPQISANVWGNELPNTLKFDSKDDTALSHEGQGFITYCGNLGACDTSVDSGEFTFDFQEDFDDSVVYGTYNITTQGGKVFMGDFSAARSSDGIELCG